MKRLCDCQQKVSTLGSLVSKGATFSKTDIAEMQEQPFAKKTGAFTPAQFEVSAGMGMAGMQLSTAMFLSRCPMSLSMYGWKAGHTVRDRTKFRLSFHAIT